jgi:hypothetical protein
MKHNWRILLKKMYEKGRENRFYQMRETDVDDSHPLMEEIPELTAEEFNSAVNFLLRNDLIDGNEEGVFALTTKGFEVARDIEQSRLQNQTNTQIAWFTLIIALVEIVSITRLITVDQGRSANIALGVIAITLTGLAVASIFKPDLMHKVSGIG